MEIVLCKNDKQNHSRVKTVFKRKRMKNNIVSGLQRTGYFSPSLGQTRGLQNLLLKNERTNIIPRQLIMLYVRFITHRKLQEEKFKLRADSDCG